MINVKKFTFNAFSENTYVLFDQTKECVIIDPGCYEKHEQVELVEFIQQNQLKPTLLLNTHCHIDHILGNAFIKNQFSIPLLIHQEDLITLRSVPNYAHLYGFTSYIPSPDPEKFINEKDIIKFGNSELTVIFGPGHAPGHIAFYSEKDKFIINGDILFQGSFGRTDLPGGDFDTLKETIINTMFNLPEDTIVYCGHGIETTIGVEKKSNAMLSY